MGSHQPDFMAQQHEAVPQGQHEAPPQDPPVAYVAEQFVKHYYGVVQNDPRKLNLFYTPNSMYTLHVPGGQSVTVLGGEGIKNKIEESLGGPCEVKQLSWSHQLSLHSSLVLSVAGQLLSKSNGSVRRFAQTFVLAVENGNRNAYYVHNDICCYFEDIPAPAVGLPANTTAPRSPAPLVPVSPVIGDAPKSPEKSPTFGTAPGPTGDDAPVELHLPLPQAPAPEAPVEVVEPEPAAAPPAPLPPVEVVEEPQAAQPEPEPVQPAAAPVFKPSSWAGITALHRPKPVEPEKPPPRKAGAPGSGGAQPKDAEKAEANNSTEEAENSKEDTTASVFVSGVPNGCEKENLDEVMGKFGEVKKIVIKAEKHYAIIDFTDAEGAQRALEAPAPKYDGSILKIEKRREGGDVTRGKGNRRDKGQEKGGRGRGGGKSTETAAENGFTQVPTSN